MEKQKAERSEKFKRNTELEMYLKDINFNLWNAEKNILEQPVQEYPLIFVVGPLRSGTTLMTQWLANTGQFAYPTNLLSRFYEAPIIGAQIQRLLTDEKFNFRNEIMDFNSEVNYTSENGKTKGALAPNEFWYFWRRFIPFGELDYLPNEELMEKTDIKLFQKEFWGMANVFEKPFALKGMICNYNLGFLNQIFKKAIFIYTKRNPITNIESALKARERQLGNINQWYSFKIPEYYELLKIKNPIKQTAGQIYHINMAVNNGLEKIENHKKLVVPYEDFCSNPEKYYHELIEKLNMQGYKIEAKYNGNTSFDISRDKIDPVIDNAYKEYVYEIENK